MVTTRSSTFRSSPPTTVRKRPAPLPHDRTPLARLSEGSVHAIVGYQLAMASIVTNQVFDDRAGGTAGLRRVEFTILALIQDNPDVTARQLAKALAVTPPNIALWLDRLESRRLIERERSTSDARLQHVRLTRAGALMVRRATERLLEGEHAALATLSAAEHAMLVELLHKVAIAREDRKPKRPLSDGGGAGSGS